MSQRSVRQLAALTLFSVESGRATLGAELDRFRGELRDERDRGLLLELAAGTLRWRNTVDALLRQCSDRPFAEVHDLVLTVLRIATYELHYLSRMPPHAVVNEAVEAARALKQERASGFVNAVLRTMTRKKETLVLPARPDALDARDAWLDYLEVTLSHPRWLAARYFDRVGPEAAEAWCRYNNAVPTITVRPAADIPADEFGKLSALLDAAGGTPARHIQLPHVAWRVPAGALALLTGGERDQVTVQDEASQLVAIAIDAKPGHRVLDLCAAPGGKSAMLSRDVGASGVVISCDTRPARLKVLKQSLRREGLTPHIARIDASMPLPFADTFDRVLLDAPCSGLGTIGRDPDVKWSRDEAALERFAQLQRAMIEQAASAVRPGGRLVYATCSSEPEENQQIADAFLSTHADFTRATPDLSTRPDRDGLDAFYAAVLVRRETP